MLKEAQSRPSIRDIKKRQDLSERSFAQSTRYGFKQARWRGLVHVSIQDYLIASIQNIVKLITPDRPKKKIASVMLVIPAKSEANIPANSIFSRFLGVFMQNTKNINPSFCSA
jgi:hypothetical protein